MNEDFDIMDLIERAILGVKDDILDKEKILYECYDELNLLNIIDKDNLY